MEEKNINRKNIEDNEELSREEMDEIRSRYISAFNELPVQIIPESEESYCLRMKKALERGRPITDEDIDEDFPLEDEDGNPIIY